VADKRYVKGRGLEYRVRDKLRRMGFFATRLPASKPFDVLAVKKGVVLFVECKYPKSHFPESEKKELIELAEKYGAVPCLARNVDGRIKIIDLRDGTSVVKS